VNSADTISIDIMEVMNMIPNTMADFVRKQLLKYEGFAYMGTVGDAEDPNGFGLVLQGANGKKVILWALRDPEGNGPGYVEAQDI
jgi:hypothetical protein